jgi:glycosyltransferase 2 family protein
MRAIFGIAVSLVAVLLVLASVDPVRTAEALRGASPVWLAIVAGLVALDIVLRAVRWRRLLAPIRRVGALAVLDYLLIGYLANNILPARLGEVVRCHFLGDREGISRTTVIGTVVVERVVDIAVVVAIAAVAVLVLSIRGVVASAVIVGAAIGALLVVALALGVAAHRLPGATRVAALVAAWPWLGNAVRKLRLGLAVAANPRTLLEAVALSLLAWTAALLAFAAAGQALGVELTLSQASLLAAGVTLAAAIPTGPAALGTFELASVQIGAAFGIATERALALGIIMHVAIFVLTSVGGVVALVRLGPTRTVQDTDIGRAA